MARGRFLDKRTATDERLATVSLKANYLYFALTPFFDIEGKHSGNATLVKAAACPLSPSKLVMPDLRPRKRWSIHASD